MKFFTHIKCGRPAALMLLLFSLTYLLSAQPVNFQWAKQLGGPVSDVFGSMTMDASGNIYTAGTFVGTVDMDPGPGVYNLVSSNGNNTFISKLDADGNFIWAKQFIGGYVGNTTIKTDATGNIYVSGRFEGSVTDFDPGPGVYNLDGVFGEIFIVKLDANGNLVWAKQFGNTNPDTNTSALLIDNSGNIYLTGKFSAMIDCDPGTATVPLSTTNTGIFIIKLTNSGDFIWVKQLDGPFDEESRCIGLDNTGNILVGGYFDSPTDFDPGPGIYLLTPASTKGIFILKLTAVGDFVWAKTMGNYSLTNSMAIDASGNIYTTGFCNGGDFDPGPGVFNLVVASDQVFISKLNMNGDFVWAKQMGGVGYGKSIFVDAPGNVYSTGYYTQTADFDPGPETYNLTAVGEGSDVFISKLDVNGNFAWAKSMGGIYNDVGYAIVVTPLENVYTAGRFQDVVDFDPGPNIYNLTAFDIIPQTFNDIFVHKMSRCSNVTTANITASACFNYTLNGQTYTASGVYTQTLVNTNNCDSVITLNLTIAGSITTTNATACNSYTWQGQTYNISGVYTMTFTGSSGCDSVLKLNLTIKNSSSATINASVCQGQSYAGYSASGTYIDTYIAANGCDSVRTLNLIVKPKSFSTLNASICEGENYLGHAITGVYKDTLTATNGCDSIRTLNLVVNPKKFTTVNASVCNGQSYFAGGANQTLAGIYKDTLASIFGCDSIITTNLVVHANPVPNLGQDKNLCVGKPLVLTPGTFTGYQWQDQSASPGFTVTNTGIFWVTVTDNNNCSATDTIKILNAVLPPSNLLKATDSVCQYDPLRIEVSNGYAKYTWSNGTTQFFTIVDLPGQYILTVTDFNGCTGDDTIMVYSKNCYSGVFIPTAFTPNGDQLNDLFKAKVYGHLLSFRLEVFDRFGQIVFRTTDPQKGWNGLYGGKASSTAVFVWQCSYQLEGGAPSYQKGTITVIH